MKSSPITWLSFEPHIKLGKDLWDSQQLKQKQKVPNFGDFVKAPPGGQSHGTKVDPISKCTNFAFWTIQFGQTSKKLWPINTFDTETVDSVLSKSPIFESVITFYWVNQIGWSKKQSYYALKSGSLLFHDWPPGGAFTKSRPSQLATDRQVTHPAFDQLAIAQEDDKDRWKYWTAVNNERLLWQVCMFPVFFIRKQFRFTT